MRTVWRRLAALCLAAILVAACSAQADDPPVPVISSSQPLVDYQALEAAIETKIMSGSVGWQTIEAVLVSVDGETKIAHYRNGRKPEEALHVWSVTKSVTSALIGIALNEQIISSLDQTLAELLPKYRRHMTVEEKQISLRQLMDMTAGFPPDQPRDVIWKVFQYGQDPVPLILTEGLSVPPGEVFQYSSRSSHLVSAVLQAALERASDEQFPTVLAYARAKLFDPLEIDTRPAYERPVQLPTPLSYDTMSAFGWGTDAAGLHSACCLLRLRPVDMIKMGELYLGDGVWHGKQILPPGWVEQSTTAGPLSSEYALMWWRMAVIPTTDNPTPSDTLIARGSEGQLIAIVPDRHLVVAVGSVPTKDYAIASSDVSFLLTDVILPALS
ncbi:MAG TPA: serine hydrolase [Propionibacteriaceae bacterium]|nr:serine hydrolase [Propionibacteriaceae bacterium]